MLAKVAIQSIASHVKYGRAYYSLREERLLLIRNGKRQNVKYLVQIVEQERMILLNEIKDLYFLQHVSLLLQCISEGTILATDKDTDHELK